MATYITIIFCISMIFLDATWYSQFTKENMFTYHLVELKRYNGRNIRFFEWDTIDVKLVGYAGTEEVSYMVLT